MTTFLEWERLLSLCSRCSSATAPFWHSWNARPIGFAMARRQAARRGRAHPPTREEREKRGGTHKATQAKRGGLT